MLTYFLVTFAQRIGRDDVQGIERLEANEVLVNTLNLVYFASGVSAVIVLIIGAIMYTTSAGRAASVTKAKGMITYSIVGLVVVASAFMITNFVRGAF